MRFPASRLAGIISVILWAAFPAPAPGESWARSIGTANGDAAFAMTTADNGDFILAGATERIKAGTDDFFLVRLAQNGEVRWTKAYGTGGSEWADAVVRCVTGGFYVAGGCWQGNYHDILCLSLSATGRVRWQRRFGGDGDDLLQGAAPTSDGGCVLVGSTTSFGAGEYDAWCLKLASNGSVEWQEAIGTAGSDGALSVTQTADGGYLVAGWQALGLWLARLDPSGHLLWETAYHGIGSGAAIRLTSDGGCVVLAGGLLRLDSSGNVLWAKLLKDPIFPIGASAMVMTPDEGMAACVQYPTYYHQPGWSHYCAFDKTGAIKFQGNFGKYLGAVGLASDGGCVFAGYRDIVGRSEDMSVLRLEPDGQFEGGCSHIGPGRMFVEDCTVTATPVTSVVTTTTVQGVATKLRSSTPEVRIKPVCAAR
ncbi:MAG: hypothetical protein AB1714_07275 [Acidobacteriota bacterium]